MRLEHERTSRTTVTPPATATKTIWAVLLTTSPPLRIGALIALHDQSPIYCVQAVVGFGGVVLWRITLESFGMTCKHHH
jgi:hypothetical protein